MTNDEELKELRIHIGNISPKLSENKQALSTRLGKFGEVIKDLELHTKPTQDYYFGFITLRINNKNFEKLKGSLHGILFMGMKLTVSVARETFQERWLKDAKRPDVRKSERIKRDKINSRRLERIKESNTRYRINPLTGTLITSSTIGANNAALGYLKSSHTYNNISGNTKNQSPSHSLIGLESYSSLASASVKPNTQQYSKKSGGSELINGRLRETNRPNTHFLKRQQTLRVLINGELKIFKCYKTKLWGIEKNKTSKDLTWKYSNGVWKSGDDHIIERTTVKINDSILGGPAPIKCGINSNEADHYGKDIETNNAVVNEEDEELMQENMKNKSVLASIFSNYDFNKPVEIEDNDKYEDDITVDEKGRRKVLRYDYEIEGGLHYSDSEAEQDVEIEKGKESIEHYINSVDQPKEEVYYDEDDEGNELDLDALGQQYTTEVINQKYNDDHGFEIVKSNNEPQVSKPPAQEDESSEDEFIPTFGQPIATVNNTETLRSLFNPGKSQEDNPQQSELKLALSEDDEDIDNNKAFDVSHQRELLNQIKVKQQEESLKQASNKFGLFWPHLNSPFLQAQSQLSKVGNLNELIKLPGESDVMDNNDDDEFPYEKWFWGVRGEFSRECKRRKRDVLKIFKKKSNRLSTV